MIMMLLPFSAMASIPEINELADRYSSVEDVTVVNLTGEMLAMAGASGEIDPSVIENIVVIQSEKARYVKDVSKHFDKMVADANLKSIANIDKDGTVVNIYQKSIGDVKDSSVNLPQMSITATSAPSATNMMKSITSPTLF